MMPPTAEARAVSDATVLGLPAAAARRSGLDPASARRRRGAWSESTGR